MAAFKDVANMPNVIGAVDGTHVRIQAPSEEEWAYVNRKGEHSINVQVKIIKEFCNINVFMSSTYSS